MQHVDPAFGRVALFGGAYSNWLATAEVIDDALRRGADAVWFLGDAGGFRPHPDRTIEILRERGVRSIQGNYDDSVGNARDDCACGYTDARDNHFAQISYDYTLAHTSAEHRTWLAALPPWDRIQVGSHTVHLCHGSPRKVNEFLWESTTPAGFVAAQCDAVEATAVACTHTGLHWARWLPDGRGIVNVPAVGRPAKRRQARDLVHAARGTRRPARAHVRPGRLRLGHAGGRDAPRRPAAGVRGDDRNRLVDDVPGDPAGAGAQPRAILIAVGPPSAVGHPPDAGRIAHLGGLSGIQTHTSAGSGQSPNEPTPEIDEAPGA